MYTIVEMNVNLPILSKNLQCHFELSDAYAGQRKEK